MNRLLITILSLLIFQLIHAQREYEIRGSIIDAKTKTALPGASVAISKLNQGTSSDINGVFALKVAKGKHELSVRFLGYKSYSETVELNSNSTLKIELIPETISMQDIEVSAQKNDQNIRDNNIGQVQISSKEFNLLPSLMGKPDIINAMRLTPGIQSVGEGNPGLYIRGGDAGQNLFLLDGMPLYNPAHLMGFFPVFNNDIVDHATVIKGGIPSQYGGKASAVLDIDMKGEQPDQFGLRGSIGLLSSGLTLESPFNKHKGSLLISVRKTYLEFIKNIGENFYQSGGQIIDNSLYNFTDGSIKLSYRLGDKSRIYASAFASVDHYQFTEDNYQVSNTMDWSNSVGSLRFNHQINSQHFFNAIVGKTNYYYDIDADFQDYGFNLHSNINDWYGKLDFTYLRKGKLPIHYGLQYTHHELTPNKVNISNQQLDYMNQVVFYSREYSAYINSDFEINDRLKLSAGIRPTLFQHIGPYTQYIRNEQGQISDSNVYAKNESIQDYFTLDGNFNAAYQLNKKSSLKGSLSVVHQFIHLAAVGTVSLPTDTWIPSTSFIPPQRVSQINLGYFKNFKENSYESSVEIYAKDMQNQIEFKNGVLDNYDNTKFEDNIIIGKGYAYGIEFFAKKKTGDLTGWIGYTLSRTLRQFDELNNGELYPAKYDRIHDLTATVNYKINHRWSVSAAFIYATGNAMTLPAGRYLIQGSFANHYTEVNSFRMPAYHRLDLSANYQLNDWGRLESFLNFSVYNAYNRANPYYIYFSAEGNMEEFKLSVKPEQVTLFPILPSVTWIFKF